MPKNAKIALAMILKGDENPEVVDRCLSSIAKWVDGIFLTITTEDKGVSAIGKKYGAFIDIVPDKFHRVVVAKEVNWLKKSFGYDPVVKAGDKIFEFDKARNYNWSKVGKEYKWVLWMDADDVFRAGRRIRKIIKDAEARKAESIFLNYLYQVEIVKGKIKNVIIQHLRERIVRNNGAYKWVAPIHETLIEKRPTVKIESKECDVLHLSNHDRMQAAIQRNIRTLELSVYDTKGKDPRPIYYLGKAYFDLKTDESFKRALGFFKVYLNGSPEYQHNNKSGWAEERSQCWEFAAEVYRKLGKIDHSIKACLDALKEDDKFPSIYLNMALNYIVKKEWARALRWVKLAIAVPPPQTTLVSNPRDLKARALEVTYHASINLSLLDEASNAAKKLVEMYPDSTEMINRYKFTRNLTNERELTKIIMELSKYLQAVGEQNKIKPLLSAVPAAIGNNPFIVDLHKKVFPPRKWEDNEIAIMCGQGFTPWSPKQLENPKGTFMGGAEEAVVYLCKELSKLGWKVTVYGDPGADEGEYDGVKYVPYYKFNGKDDFNILVGWRNPAFVDGNYKAKKIYIWLHDIQNPLDYTEERIKKMDKVIFLSPWHRENVPALPDDKVVISNNGIML